MVRIYLIRHAEAEGNLRGVFQGIIDSDITETGAKQLDLLAERFRSIPIEAIYSSPLKRTIKTAQAVSRFHDLPVIIREGLIEINGGKWEDRTWGDLSVEFPEEMAVWSQDIVHFKAPGGESTRQVYDRIKAVVNAVAAENIGRTIAVVSHGMTIKTFLAYAAGLEWEEYKDTGWADKTAVSLIEYDDELVPHIVFANDSSHLDTLK